MRVWLAEALSIDRGKDGLAGDCYTRFETVVMDRIAKTIEFSVPASVANDVERLAAAEKRTKDELLCEMVRVYREHRFPEPPYSERFILELFEQAKANPMSDEEIRAAESELVRYGEQQARKLGIKPKDVNRLIREYRAENHA